jgi:hypothetical protein
MAGPFVVGSGANVFIDGIQMINGSVSTFGHLGQNLWCSQQSIAGIFTGEFIRTNDEHHDTLGSLYGRNNV